MNTQAQEQAQAQEKFNELHGIELMNHEIQDIEEREE